MRLLGACLFSFRSVGYHNSNFICETVVRVVFGGVVADGTGCVSHFNIVVNLACFAHVNVATHQISFSINRCTAPSWFSFVIASDVRKRVGLVINCTVAIGQIAAVLARVFADPCGFDPCGVVNVVNPVVVTDHSCAKRRAGHITASFLAIPDSGVFVNNVILLVI